MQAPFNAQAHRPVYASPSDAPDTFYKLTNREELHFDGATNGGGMGYDFHTWPY